MKSNMPWVQKMVRVKINGIIIREDKVSLRIATFEKNSDGTKTFYHNWLANVRPMDLRDKARDLVEGDYININKAVMKTWYSKNTGKGGVIMDIIEFEMYSENNEDQNPFEDKKEESISEDDLPF